MRALTEGQPAKDTRPRAAKLRQEAKSLKTGGGSHKHLKHFVDQLPNAIMEGIRGIT